MTLLFSTYEVQAVYKSYRTLAVEVPAGADPIDPDNWTNLTVIDDDEQIEVIDAVKMEADDNYIIDQVKRERDELRQRNAELEAALRARSKRSGCLHCGAIDETCAGCKKESLLLRVIEIERGEEDK
jgi:hypothetical protein